MLLRPQSGRAARMYKYGSAVQLPRNIAKAPEGLGRIARVQKNAFRAGQQLHGPARLCVRYVVARACVIVSRVGVDDVHILRRGGKTLLYALDSGGYDPDMLELIFSERYDGVITEGTLGLCDAPADGHMSKAKNVAFRKALLEYGCISEDTPVFLTHMSPHWTPPHDLYAPMMAEEGFTVAYDGMIAEI